MNPIAKFLNFIFRPFILLFQGLFSFLKPKKIGRQKTIILIIFIVAVLAASLDYPKYWDKAADWLNSQKNKITILETLPNIPQFYLLPFRLGLDLAGGTHLVYEADISGLAKKERDGAMEGVRDVIERRINLFGVAEPIVQIDKAGEHHRLIVELAGIKNISEAIKMIGETPSLDFRTEKEPKITQEILEAQEKGERLDQDPYFEITQLTGKYLKKAQLSFGPQISKPEVSLEFDNEGSKIFEDLTRQNIKKRIAIYLDGQPISMPMVQEAISGGRAQITGDFSVPEAKELVSRLNAGALPVPIELINQKTVGASLGETSLNKSLKAGLIGIVAVALFMLLYYRLSGLLAVIALLIYAVIVLAIFKLIPVTLTLAGIAGFILSVGMAVDANILIFERMKEELRGGKSFSGAIDEGFERAWTSIRDSNVSSLITCVILYWLGTSVIRGFALTLAIGILASMFSAIFITRQLLKLFVKTKLENYQRLWR